MSFKYVFSDFIAEKKKQIEKLNYNIINKYSGTISFYKVVWTTRDCEIKSFLMAESQEQRNFVINLNPISVNIAVLIKTLTMPWQYQALLNK